MQQKMGTGFRRTALALAAFSLLLTAASCSSGGGGGSGPPGGTQPTFTGSGTAATTGLIRLANGRDIGGGLMEIDVVIDGAVAGEDVFSFVFDVIMSNPGIVDFISVTPGPALSTGAVTALGSEGLNGADTAAVIGVSLQNPAPGDDDIPVGEQVICTLTFQTVAVGDSDLTFAGDTPVSDPEALDSLGGAINQATIFYDGASAMISGS